MSTVLMLHLWREPEITAAMVLNEAALMAIGVFMGIAANLYMPDRIQDIRRAQEQVESRLRGFSRRWPWRWRRSRARRGRA